MVGTLDVDAMLESMPEGLFAEWCEFDRVEPIGPQKVCDVVAEVAALLAMQMELKDQHGQSFTPESFMHWVKRKPVKQKFVSPEESAKLFGMSFRHGNR